MNAKLLSKRDFLKLIGLGTGAALVHPSLTLAADIAETPDASTPFRVGQWLPSDQRHLEGWLSEQIARAEQNPQPLHPVVQELKDIIDTDSRLYMLFTQMFRQVPFNTTPIGTKQVRDYQQALILINQVLTTAPEFNKTGLVGFPINAILDWAMGTQAGFAAFLNERVNVQIKKILNEWGRFLGSPDSRYVLSDDPRHGWFGRNALEEMPHFAEDFKCDPTAPYYGFSSWDDFFTREFREGIRPVAFPDDDSFIVNACESAPFKVARNVQRTNRFWIKAQPYSLMHMLANDEYVDRFVGGTVYQAFLSALSYHRWHSPISGRIVKRYIKEGTYYSQALSEGFDKSSPNNSQGYLTEVATRAIMFIEADNPAIGLMCVMQIGMAEVSTCEMTVKEGQHVKKGDQLGMFHFGGSTYCMIFGPQVRLKFDLQGQKPGLHSKNIKLNTAIARVI